MPGGYNLDIEMIIALVVRMNAKSTSQNLKNYCILQAVELYRKFAPLYLGIIAKLHL